MNQFSIFIEKKGIVGEKKNILYNGLITNPRVKISEQRNVCDYIFIDFRDFDALGKYTMEHFKKMIIIDFRDQANIINIPCFKYFKRSVVNKNLMKFREYNREIIPISYCLRNESLHLDSFKHIREYERDTDISIFFPYNDKINQKRMIYPKERNFDIHGCKGYWDTNYQKLSEQKIMNEIEHIGESSTFHDSRKNNFKEEIQKDGNTIYKLSFMYLPIKEISSSSGKIINDGIIFNNKRYGLIYDSSLSRATYLPNVYPNESWSDIKSHLKKKGWSNSILENNVNEKFYAYKIFTIEDSIFSVLFSKSYISFLVSRIFSSFNILLEKSDFLPYIIDNDGKISIEKNQSVRNLVTLNDFLKMKRFSFKGESIEDINNCINKTIG